MRLLKAAMALLVVLLFATDGAEAQSTTGTIRGHVEDAQGLALPGVTVSITSPNLQGVRTTVTSELGDFTAPLLPPGSYKVTFELSGFALHERSFNIAATEVVPLDVVMGPAGITETVTVTATQTEVLMKTTQVATNFKQELIAALPTNRDINATILQAPGVHATGPSGNYSIAGSVSFENLFMVNGVAITENLRGTPYTLYIEDAIQETTVAVAGISAENGRFTGGVVNVITKSGGNDFTGSFRDTYNNDKWRRVSPYEKVNGDTRVDKVVPEYIYTFGGPVLRNRLWFFTAGRAQTQSQGRTLNTTLIPYTYQNKRRNYEGKLTYSPTSNHRFQGNFQKVTEEEVNYTFNQNVSMDLRSLGTRKLPQDIFTVNYNGVITPSLSLEARVSQRNYEFIGVGAKSRDLIEGTLLIDQSKGTRYWADTFCGICDPEQRNNEEYFVKGTYFLSTPRIGTHTMTFGYDNFNDIRKANNYQSGSDYRILGTGSYAVGGDVIPKFLGDNTTVIQWNPIPSPSQGSNFRLHSLFYNDTWQVGSRVTANIGLRLDKNHGLDQEGKLVIDSAAFSPRFGVVIDPTGSGVWSINASFARYVAAISNTLADASSAAGNSQTYQYYYQGPSINAAAPVVSTPDAIRQVFDWYNANQNNLVFASNPNIPGLTPQISPSLRAPSTYEYSGGVSRQIGSRTSVRIDGSYRDYQDFYAGRIDASTGKVQNQFGRSFDLRLIENSNVLTRQYAGMTSQVTYRPAAGSEVGGQYTLSRAWGNFEGETVSSGPGASTALEYPEYKQESWNYPTGDLSIDQRHRARLWATYNLPWVQGLSLGAIQTLESGVPYGASNANTTGNFNGINPQPFVTNTVGYVTPPTGSNTIYFYTNRDAFRTEGQKRTDLSVNYVRNVPGVPGMRGFQLFAQAQVINLFNQFQLCGCAGTVFQNGGATTQTRINTAIRTSVSHASTYTAFNPFTQTPVQGVNWDLDPAFGTPLNRLAYTSPQQFRFSVGFRF